MIDTITLSEIFVGKADGLMESEYANFHTMFYKGNNKYEKLVNNDEKFIISGRKGTGKTILAKYFEMQQNDQGIVTKTITNRDINLKLFSEKNGDNLEKKEIELFAQYTILSELASLIVEHKKKFYKFKNIFKWWKIRSSIHYLERITKKRYSSENFIMVDYNKITEDEMAGGLVHTASIEKKRKNTINSQYKRNPYYQLITQLENNILYLMRYMSINLIFDDLDEYDDIIIQNSAIVKLINSFIIHAYTMNRTFKAKGIAHSRIIILLRSDILSILNNSSKSLNKIVCDSNIRLHWLKKQKNLEDGHPLMNLILEKIRNSNEDLNYYTNEEIFYRFFPLTVSGVPIMDYMLNYSFGRPRDFIHMLNTIKEEYPLENKFSADLFRSTQLEYCEKFLGELRNEMSSHYGSDVIEETFLVIQLLNKRNFWISELDKTLEEHQDKLKFFKNSKKYIEIAYGFGIVGNTWMKQNAKGKKKNHFSWRYKEDGHDYPDYDKKFCVHMALRKVLLQ